MKWAFLISGFELFCLVILGVILLWLWRSERIEPFRRIAIAWRQKLGWLRWPLTVLLICTPIVLIYHPLTDSVFTNFDYDQLTYLTRPYLRLFFFLLSLWGTAVLLTRDDSRLVRLPTALVAGVLIGGAFVLATLLIEVTDYPFTLYWSEGNRFWDYSVLFGRDRYLYPADQPIPAYIDIMRQSLWGLPFLFPNLSIWGMRLWNAILFSLPYAILGWLATRPQKKAIWPWLLFGLWSFTFLNQGPIWTPLVLAAILVAVAYRLPIWLGAPVLILAGYYASKTRITWMFAPAMWVGMLALVAPAKDARRLTTRDWVKAGVLALAGVIGGFGIRYVWPRLQTLFSSGESISLESLGQTVEILTPGGATEVATQQPLLWSRLLPNATYGPGILFGLAIATLPVILLVIYLIRRHHWRVGAWQIAALILPLAAFLIVGVVASAKIGGGTNLHNLDMFLIGLLFAVALAWDAASSKLKDLAKNSNWVSALLLLAVAIPAFTPMVNARPLELPSQTEVETALNDVEEYVACAQQYGEVLFMDHRQLLTFGYIEDVPLVADYEKKLVMDKALSRDGSYFEDFYWDLSSQRFSLIILDPQNTVLKGRYDSLYQENNAWVFWVTIPLLDSYESVAQHESVALELFMPLGRDFTCP